MKIISLSAVSQFEMKPAFSIYLDLIRFFAAIAVFVNHLSLNPFTKGIVPRQLSTYGDAAVIIFFVLSGYVIAYVVSAKERTALLYFSSRAARLYSVVFIALLLTFIFDTIGKSLNPEFYTLKRVLPKPESWTGYVASAFFLNEYKVFGQWYFTGQ
jgi:peptidoglycan/LPS O-acetylase OafA/YrhL